ncbi:phosphatidate phosphatase LPIN3 [Tribolium castaneum]|uniref:phosphatidate phosphatase n=1 Tax=Tribolium castaneum TaxID=7070 RepID=D6WRL3_TRICA|nr:PREDICTED: phosphatidate phosphatase LPIN3 [Tribolium castaneum]EFA07054.2 Phosphatidate phosphatase LPIN3-like Protein [Tribolium castaneum]|eukprot:XP_975581.3 PREDICTED: phosphatidate phosphatase LPIN3 [Tribolium castaneum]
MYSMNYIGRFFSNFREFYNEINTATLTGAIDVIVVEQEDGTYKCSPFHVRFGKLGVLRSREKVVDIEINGEPADIHMKLGESGEAFFVEELEDDENEIPDHLATSPIPVNEFENIFTSQGRRRSFGEPPTLENEINDYTKRRNTADNESSVKRERDFLKRQIGLGNIGIGENSTEDMSRSMHSTTKESVEDLSKDNDISDTIFKMDSLEMDTSRSESGPKPEEASQGKDEHSSESRSSKKKRRKTKKKNAPRKSSSVNQISPEVAEKNDSATTDPSSIESNSSEPELKELQNVEGSAQTPSNSRKIIDPDFHFFSDTELTSNVVDSRADSPIQVEAVQSDSEFEVKNRKGDNKDNGQSWEWGGFPSVSPTNSPISEQATKNDQFAISNVFSFMKKSHGQTEGIYLSDLNSVDPEVAALYFSTNKNKTTDADMDCESGNGPSLAQSPNSAEGCKSIDSDFDEHIKGGRLYSNEVSLSLCGWDPEPDATRFDEHMITFSDFCNNPMLLEDPNLVVNIRGKYYNWKVAAPIISSIMVFNRPLLQSSIDQLCNIHMPSNQESKDNKQEAKTSWWHWRRSKTSREATPTVDTRKTVVEVKDTAIDIGDEHILQTDISVAQKIPKTEETEEKDKECAISISPQVCQLSEKCRKTLRLSSKQIASLNLRDGMNEIVFSVTTAYQGTTRCTCHLYKWKWDDKIVISDIDGTITKSDVLGHILPIVGKDWAQSGVAQLFNKIKGNGYKLLYLSARAIGQARITREYLRSIKQGNLTMPDGPILLNPTSLITAFHREVIEKKPEQFKISCMSDIKALFPSESNPFYAGYGNRINDVWAYRAVGIPIVRIFTINPKGELKHELTQTFQSTYSTMTYYVDQLFPPLIEAANDYSQFAYWRDPLPVVEELPEVA